MKQYLLTFETVTPLMIGERHTAQSNRSLQYIPGSSTLGGLAYAYLREQKLAPEEKDARFDRLFLSDRVYFGNLYPANFSPPLAENIPVKPLPKTARSCKRWQGFTYQSETAGEENHGVGDHLIPWSLFAKTAHQDLRIPYEHRLCHCGERLDAFSGFYRMHSATKCALAHLNTRLITRTGINRRTGTVQEGILYSFEMIAGVTDADTPQVFQGILRIDEEIEDDFLQFLKHDGLHFRVGKAKTRGLGRLQFKHYTESPPVSQENFGKRLERFNTAFKALAATYQLDVGNRFYFALTCCSDVIIQQDDLRYRTVLTGDYLEDLLGLPGLTLIYHNASTRVVKGWHTLWRLPKIAEVAIEKGSVFLLEYSGNPDSDFYNKLYALETTGIGNRKTEGFGWVSISDDFHREVKQR